MSHIVADLNTEVKFVTSTGTTLTYVYSRVEGVISITRKITVGGGAGTVPATIEGIDHDAEQLKHVVAHFRTLAGAM